MCVVFCGEMVYVTQLEITEYPRQQSNKILRLQRPQECEMWKRTFLILAVLFSGRNKDPFIVPFSEHFVPSRASYGEFQ